MSYKKRSKKMGIIGSVLGLVMFLIYGLLQGMLVGGTAGIKVCEYLSAEGNVASRATAFICMGLGVVTAAFIFIAGGFSAGRIIDYMIGAFDRREKKVPDAERLVQDDGK